MLTYSGFVHTTEDKLCLQDIKALASAGGTPRPWICSHCGTESAPEQSCLSSLRFLHPEPSTKWMLGRALTRHKDGYGFVVWISIRDGLGQMVNSHVILLARIYHKVAEGKPPLRKRGKRMGHTRSSSTVCKVPISHLLTISKQANEQKEERITTESHIRGMLSLSFLSV